MFRTTGKLRFINNSGGEFVPNVLDPAFTNDSQLVLRFGSDGVYTPWVVKEEHINSQVPFCIGKDSGIILSGDYMVEDTAPEDVDILLVASYNNGYPSYLQHIGVKNLRTGTITNTTESGATPFTVKSPFTDDAPSLVCCDEERGFIYGLQYDYSADGITITRWSYDYQSAETRVLGFPIPQLDTSFIGTSLSCDGNILTIVWYKYGAYEIPYKTEYNWETNQITTKVYPIQPTVFAYLGGYTYHGSYGSKKLSILEQQGLYKIYIVSETDTVKVYELVTTDDTSRQPNLLQDVFGRLWFVLTQRYDYEYPTFIDLCNLQGVKQSIRCPLLADKKLMWLDDNGLVFTYKRDVPQQCNPPFNRIVQRCTSVKDGLKHTSEILGALPITPFSTTPQYYLRQEMKLRNKIVGIYTDYNYYTSSQQTKVSVYEIDTTTGQSQVTYETTLSSFIKWPSNLSAFSSALTLLKAKHSHNKDILALPNGITKNKNNVNLSFDFKNDVDLDDLKCTIDWGDGTSTTYLSNGKIMPTITDFAVTNALETTSSSIRISIKTPTNFSVTFDDPDMCIQSFLFYPGGTESPLWINIQNPTINGAKVTQTFSYQYFTVIKKVPQITKIRTKDNKIYSIFFPFAFIKKYLSGIASNSYITIQYTDSYFGDCVPTTSEIVSTASFPGTSTFVRVNVTAPNIVSKINAVWYVLEARSARRVYSDIHHNDILELPFFCARQYHMLQYDVTLIDGTVLSYDAYRGMVSTRSEASSYTVHTYSDDMCLVECTPSYFNEGPSDSNEILIDLGPRKYLHYDEIVDVTDTSCQTDFMIIPSSFTTSEKLYMSWWWQNKTNNTFCPLGRIFYVNSLQKFETTKSFVTLK